MQAVIDRAFCVKHPFRIARLFGVDVAIGMLLRKDKTLLERLSRKYSAHRVAMPGVLGDAYRVSALIELRAAHIYAAMARRFHTIPAAHRLFKDLEEEELEHARLMLACLYQIAATPRAKYAPRRTDPQIRGILRALRRVEQDVKGMTLDQALEATRALEASEVNAIFERLLKQVGKAQTDLFAEALEGARSHPESVPRRIAALRAQIAPEQLAVGLAPAARSPQ